MVRCVDSSGRVGMREGRGSGRRERRVQGGC